jgi:predicted Zn-dependent peptidase
MYVYIKHRVESFTLENGLTFVVLPRSTAPVVSCHIYAGVGAWEEQDGQTGETWNSNSTGLL